MTSSHSNRGLEWERILEGHHKRLETQHVGVVFRTPPPVVLAGRLRGGQYRAIPVSKGPPDYIGILKTSDGVLSFCMEAKDCAENRWHFGKLHEHQATALNKWEDAGGVSVLALRHGKSGTFWLVPWSKIRRKWSEWRIRNSFGKRAKPGTSSLSVADLEVLGFKWTHAGGYVDALLLCLDETKRNIV